MESKPAIHLHGIYRDILCAADGEIKFDSGWRSNLIVNRARMLLAAFLKNDPTQGVKYLAVGQGNAEWDHVPREPKVTDEQLFDPAPFKLMDEKLEIVYLGGTNSEPTTQLEITAKIGMDEPENFEVYPLREFGLFGEVNGIDFMIDYIIHPVIYKHKDDTLIRRVQLIFK